MPSRPDKFPKWATEPTALITEPSEGKKEQGFVVESPSVNIFNWLLNHFSNWITYLDERGAGGNSFIHSHDTTRNLIELPFEFSEDVAKKSQVDVLKRTEASIGGVGGTSFTSSVTAEVGEEGSSGDNVFQAHTPVQFEGTAFSFENFESTLQNSNQAFLESQNIFPQNYSIIENTFSTAVRFSTTPFFPFGSSYNQSLYNITLYIDKTNQSIKGIRIDSIEVAYLSDQELRELVSNLLNGKTIYYQFNDSGNYLIWKNINISTEGYYKYTRANTSGGFDFSFSSKIINIPLFRGTITPDEFVESASYQSNVYDSVISETPETGGMAIGLPKALSSFARITEFRYDAENRNLIIKLLQGSTGETALTQDAFNNFRLRRGNSDIVSLRSQEATYSAGTFTWSVPSDPFSVSGDYQVILEEGGSGLPAFTFTAITTFEIDTYDNKDYLKIISGVENADTLFIRKKGS